METTQSQVNMGRRRYSRRSDTASSSRSSRSSSVSSAFTERFSSSSSEGLPEHLEKQLKDVIPETPKDKEPALRVPSVQGYLKKRNAKNQFRQLVSRGTNRIPGWRRRKGAAEALVQLVETGPAGRDLVVRRFNRSECKLAEGLASVLQLSDEEASENGILHQSSFAARLLQMLIQRTNIFQEALPTYLGSEATSGSAGIRHILHSTLDSRVRSAPEVSSLIGFAIRVIHDDAYSSHWRRAVSLLEFMIRHYADLVKPILHTGALPDYTFPDIARAMTQGRHTQHLYPEQCHSVVLQLMRTVYARYPSSMVSTTPIELMIQEGLSCHIVAIAVNRAIGKLSLIRSQPWEFAGSKSPKYYLGSSHEHLPLRRCLALAALVALSDFSEMRSEIMDNLDFTETLFEVCFDVMLLRTEWQFEIEQDAIDADIPKLIPHEDAYDIIRKLSLYGMFTQALKELFSQARSAESPFQKHPSATFRQARPAFKLLEPLLWWSRMPHPEMKRAIMAAGVFSFLHQIASLRVPVLEAPEYRLIYRTKGDAITCMGNFFESMDTEEKALFVSPYMLENIERVVLNEDYPLTLRHQAAFALQRYRGLAA